MRTLVGLMRLIPSVSTFMIAAAIDVALAAVALPSRLVARDMGLSSGHGE